MDRNYYLYILLSILLSLPQPSINIKNTSNSAYASADLEVQLVQLNHCDGEYSNY